MTRQLLIPTADKASRSTAPADRPTEEDSPGLGPTAEPAPPPLPQDVTNRHLLRWMFQFLRPVTGLVILAAVFLAVAVGIEVLAARQTGKAIDQIALVHYNPAVRAQGFFRWLRGPEPDAAALRTVVFSLAALTAGMGILRFLREVANMRLSMEMVYHLRAAVYDKLQRVGFAFHDALSTGQLINRSLTDLQNVRSFINSAVLTTLEIVLIVGGYIALLLTRSPWVAILALAPLPFWTWYILRFSRKIQPAQKAVMEADDRNVSIITEAIAGVHVIKAFATEPHEIAKYNRNCDAFFDRVMTRIRMYANFTPVIRSIATASHLTLFLAAGILIIRRQLGPGDILMLGWAMGAILGRLQQVASINEQYQSAIVSARRLYEVLAATAVIPEAPRSQPLPAGDGAVSFEHVTFGYDPAKPVLRDVSFHVPGGKVVAIVGPTGAGKTTLVNLIARFYEPQQGRILIDGVDIRQVQLDSLRTRVAFVFQETYLFSDTVEANIAYGRPQIVGPPDGSPQTRGEVEAASRLAQAHDFVEELPKGYETMLGERGASLSGGQRQRLAIARAILSEPRILVLDDATAAIDPETEDMIRRGMRFALQCRTTFIIAHRISTVKQADLVLVLEEGRITQVGTHDQLVQAAGHYRTIAEAQLAGDEPEAERPSHMDRMRDQRKVSVAAAKARGEEAAVEEEAKV